MAKNNMTIAILYDFDKTLSTTDMQEYDFIKNLEMTPGEFWGKSAVYTQKYGMDRILAYMLVMIEECKKKGIKLTREYLNSCGKNIEYYKGVTTWFDRLAEFGDSLGVNVEHYIISSGTTEIVEGCSIAKHFKKIYGCEFFYNEEGEAVWPNRAINFTLKTQYVFRISKGVLDVKDDDNLNRRTDVTERKINYDNMIYIGDGLTDIPAMKLIREKGGRAIALYPTGAMQKAHKLIEDSRVDYVCAADYSKGSSLETYVKLMIEKMHIVTDLNAKEESKIKAVKKQLEIEE